MIGTGVEDSSVKRALRNFHYSVGKFDSAVDENQIKTFLSNKISGEMAVAELKLNHNKFKIFRISCLDTNNSVMVDPTTWPEGIVVKRFFFPRNEKNKADASSSQTNPTAKVPLGSRHPVEQSGDANDTPSVAVMEDS